MSKWIRIVGRLEAFSFLMLLVIGMPMKYLAAAPLGVRILGPVHGVLFLLYCGLAYYVSSEEKWPLRQHLLAYVAAVLPFGTLIFERKFLDSTASKRAA